MSNAQQVYQTVKDHLDANKFKYQTHDEELVITLTATGEDLPMPVIIAVDEQREVLRILSPIPAKAPEDKRIEAAVAVAAANYGIVNGSFDYDLDDGEIRFRMAQSFHQTTLNDEQIHYLIATAFSTTDRYNDKFFALCKGMTSLEDFLKAEKEK